MDEAWRIAVQYLANGCARADATALLLLHDCLVCLRNFAHRRVMGAPHASEGSTVILGVFQEMMLSEPQVLTAQLVDRPTAHQLHVAFDLIVEILKGSFDADLPRGREGIQIKSAS